MNRNSLSVFLGYLSRNGPSIARVAAGGSFGRAQLTHEGKGSNSPNLARFALCHTGWKESLQFVPENIRKPFKARFRRVKLIVPGTGLRF